MATTGPLSQFKPGDVVYCWQFEHPIAGTCGGNADEDWSTDRRVIEARAVLCPYPWTIIEKVVE